MEAERRHRKAKPKNGGEQMSVSSAGKVKVTKDVAASSSAFQSTSKTRPGVFDNPLSKGASGAGKGSKSPRNSSSASLTPASSCASLTSSPQGENKDLFLQKVRDSSDAIQQGHFQKAVALYTEALVLDPANYILYSNRSAALVKLNKLDKALKDARKSRELNPQWSKACYREGVALQCMGKVADALAAYAAGLAQEPKNTQLMETFMQAAAESSLKDKFVQLFTQLSKMKLAESPFVVTSVVGQELLAAGYFAASVTILESALRIGTCSMKLRGSVFSALSSAHWGLSNIDKAIACMQQDLAVVKSLADKEGECRVHGNLGAAYFSKGSYREALQHHRQQLLLATRSRDHRTTACALSSLGHVYTAVVDYSNALASHKQCVLIVKQFKDKLQEAREIGNVGAVYLAMGDFDNALECHNEHLKLARQLGNKVEEARAYSNLGSAHHYRRDYEKAITFHNQVLNIALSSEDRTLEARAYAGLGHAARCMQDAVQAKYYHEKQLDNALQTKDRVAEGRACSNLGIIFQQLAEYDAALKLHKASLQIVKDLGDRGSQGRAYGNIGNAYSCLGEYDLAVRFHKQELSISKEVSDRHSEASTHGNLAVAYQALALYDKASHHYNLHLNLARDLKDSSSEARALGNLGNYHSSKKDYAKAIPFYEQYLILSQELQDAEGEGKACHKLGYVHYCLGNYVEAVRYYNQELALAKDIQDKSSMCKAYCNLGLAHKALDDLPKALECQKHFLATAQVTKNFAAKIQALGNIGDLLIKQEEHEEAVKMFEQQLTLSRQLKDKKLEASSLGNLGLVHKVLGAYDKALGFHTQELTIYQELNDLRGECKAHSHLGNVHVCVGNYSNACRCYEEQLDRSRDLKDTSIEAHAYGNLGITKVNMGHFDDAIGLFEQQLAILEQVSGHQAMLDKGRSYSNLGDCYEAIGDYEEAAKCYDQYLAFAQNTKSCSDQDKAYRGLGNVHRSMGNLQQALVCFEKRLVVAHELSRPSSKSSAYGELGCLHSQLGNFEQAISCLQHQLNIAREMGDRVAEGEAACGLGGVYQQMGESDKALEYHHLDLDIANDIDNHTFQCRAYGNLGLSEESLGNYEEAIQYQQQHLSIAVKINDRLAKTLAYSSLGRIHHALGTYPEAIGFLQQGLQIAEQLGAQEDEAKIRHRLGLSLWGQGDLEEAQTQLYAAVELFEAIRREAQFNNEYKLSLFDLQTASYQALQRVLVALDRHQEALVIAERGRTRAFVDLLMERQTADTQDWHSALDSTPVTQQQMEDIVTHQRAAVLYYSMAAGYLYAWLILPGTGIVKFHESSVTEPESGSDPEDTQSLKSFKSFSSTTNLLDTYVGQTREALGIESHSQASIRPSLSRSTLVMSETESEADDLWQQHLQEVGDKLNAENDRTGFLRMVNRNHVWNASSLSLGSLLSFSGGISGTPNSRSSTRSRLSTASSALSAASGAPPLGALYELLLAPFEEALCAGAEACKELILVLQGDLYLVPFALLKKTQAAPCLSERYNLLMVPSLRALEASQAISKHDPYNPNCTGAVVIGNPKLPQGVVNMWQWHPLPGTEQECRMVAEMMGCRSLTGPTATKDSVRHKMQKAELLHFATHISWKLAAIVLSASDFSTTSALHGNLERMDLSASTNDLNASFDGPPLSDFLLTAADVLNTRISAKLVVLSSGHTDDRAGRINADGVVGLTRAFLAAGAQAVLFSLWPVPEAASCALLTSFYTALLQGAKCSQALSAAMRTLQGSRLHAHPSNWASWMLVGSDVRLSSKVALMGHAFCELLVTPSKSREAMRVVLHLVEKSLQRIQAGQRNAMYTTQQSIENRVGDTAGWRQLLMSVGFRFEAATGSVPAAVYFPTSDPGDRLTQCSASLQALLGLPIATLNSLSKLVEELEVGESVTSLVREANTQLCADAATHLPVSMALWRAEGVHEFLASLGFDLVDVGDDEVRLKAGKQANRRTLQFALQALVAVFDTQEAPRTLPMDSCSSMESLCSSGSATSTSNFSKGSSPPTSPSGKRKSFFNPAEVDKLPSANPIKVPGSKLAGKQPEASLSTVSLHLTHQNLIRQKYSSPSGSDVSDSNTDYPPLQIVEVAEPPAKEASPGGGLTGSRPRLRQSLQERNARSAFYTPPSRRQNVYSTSASDSEDATIPENNLSKLKSRSSQSLASQASTVTIKSTGSAAASNGFRRTRMRGSTTSVRSSASDRTLTNESVNASNETLTNSNDGSRSDLTTEQQRPSIEVPDSLYSSSEVQAKVTGREDGRSITGVGTDAQEPGNVNSGQAGSGSTQLFSMEDPETVAMKVLAETRSQRQALLAMQQWSVDQLQHKQAALQTNSTVLPRSDGSHQQADTEPGAKPQEQGTPPHSGPQHTVQHPAANPSMARQETDRQPGPSISNAPSKKPPLPAKPKPVLVNSLLDNSITLTFQEGVDGSNGVGSHLLVPTPLAPAGLANLPETEESEADSHTVELDSELSVIEEEAEDASDAGKSPQLFTPHYQQPQLRPQPQLLPQPQQQQTATCHLEGSSSISMSSSEDSSGQVWYDEEKGAATKGAMRTKSSASDSGSATPKHTKTVKFQDEVEMGKLAETVSFDVSFDSESSYASWSSAMSQEQAGQLSPVADRPYPGGVVGPGQGGIGMIPAGSRLGGLPRPPMPTTARPPPMVPRRGEVGPRLPYYEHQLPPPYTPPRGHSKPPPPYPGQRRQGSQDSTSSAGSGSASSSQNYAVVHQQLTPSQLPPGAGFSPTRPPLDRTVPQNSASSGSGSGSEHFGDFNTRANLQKASMQFYNRKPNEGPQTPQRQEGPFYQNPAQAYYHPKTGSTSSNRSSLSSTASDTASHDMDISVQVQVPDGHLPHKIWGNSASPASPAGSLLSQNGLSPVADNSPKKEWYLSDSDSVCSTPGQEANSPHRYALGPSRFTRTTNNHVDVYDARSNRDVSYANHNLSHGNTSNSSQNMSPVVKKFSPVIQNLPPGSQYPPTTGHHVPQNVRSIQSCVPPILTSVVASVPTRMQFVPRATGAANQRLPLSGQNAPLGKQNLPPSSYNLPRPSQNLPPGTHNLPTTGYHVAAGSRNLPSGPNHLPLVDPAMPPAVHSVPNAIHTPANKFHPAPVYSDPGRLATSQPNPARSQPQMNPQLHETAGYPVPASDQFRGHVYENVVQKGSPTTERPLVVAQGSNGASAEPQSPSQQPSISSPSLIGSSSTSTGSAGDSHSSVDRESIVVYNSTVLQASRC